MKRWHVLASFAAILLSSNSLAVDRVPMERMAAYHRSVIVTHETDVTSAFMTYFKSHPEQIKHDFLLKIVPCLDKDGVIPAPNNATEVHVEDFPGGVEAKFRIGGVEVTADLAPLLVGRGVTTWEGAAVYSITTNPPTPVLLRIGGGTSVSFLMGTPPAFVGPDTVAPKDAQLIDGNTATFQSGEDPFPMAVRATGPIERNADTGQLTARFAGGSGAVVMAYADAADRALELSKNDPQTARKAVDDYYAKLLESRIETPDENLNAAFRSAIITMEYSWIEPYGWIETIHHWLALWHMQHTAGAEWLGQEDRSRLCTLTHGRMLLPNGAVPQLWPNGHTHRDFGGSNQFWAWQVRHYMNFTGDKEFAKEVAPMLDRVLNQTFKEYDPDGDMLLAWSQQIGNQEDMIGTPCDGTTPTIEGMNMMSILYMCPSQGTVKHGLTYRLDVIKERMEKELWLPDVGRYAFFVDPLGYARLDGQYHTLIYPTLYYNSMVPEPLERYLSLRQLRDRLTGVEGDVYCSNNFPNHVSGTWGMQSGAAQQPWAAWGLSGAGMRNEAWKPLKAVAGWVTDVNHRGSWPEVAQEPIPAYFSPPAGLFIASMVESIFGLHVINGGELQIAPCFPDTWEKASLHLPGFQVQYQRNGNNILYSVKSSKTYAPSLRWHLPISKSVKATINGAPQSSFRSHPLPSPPAKFDSAASVSDTIFYTLGSERTNNATVAIEYVPAKVSLKYQQVVTEGRDFSLAIDGDALISKVADPCHLFESYAISQSNGGMRAILSRNLLKPYMGFGRLGLMNFARRSFFLECTLYDSIETVFIPVDITVLPEVEVTFGEDLSLEGNNALASLTLHGNTGSLLWPDSIVVGSTAHLVKVDSSNCPDRDYCETTLPIAIPAGNLSQVSPGENDASIAIYPGWTAKEFPATLNARSIFESGPLAAHAASRMTQIALPENMLMPDTDWRKLRDFPGFPHVPWSNSPPALEKLEGQTELAPPELPQVKFALPQRKFIPVSWKMGQPCFTLDLGGRMVKKLYVLVIPYLENHDMFAEVARMTVRGDKGAVLYTRTLRTPGDLDWWPSAEVFGDVWTTAHHGRADRHGLLPMLKVGETDWPMAHPPAFPQPEYWATCLPVITGSCTMNVVELDLRTIKPVQSLVVETLGANPALGVVAVTAEGPGDDSLLDGTPWEVPAERRQPRTVFTLTRPEALEGWELTGNAFSICAVPSLFTAPTLNSLGKAGEQASGTALSPVFEIRPADKVVVLDFQGGRSVSTPEGESLVAEIIEADTGEVIGRVLPPGVHLVQPTAIPVQVDKPTKVRLRLIDRNTDASFAWIGVSSVRVGVNVPEPAPLWN